MATGKYTRSKRYPELFRPALSLRWWAFIPRPGGGPAIRESTGHRNEAAAHNWYLERVRGSGVAANRITLIAALDAHLTDCKTRGRSAGTIDHYEKRSRALCDGLGDATTCDKIDARMVDEYIAARLAKRITRSTISRDLVVLRKTFNLARRHGFDAPDPRLILPAQFGSGYKPRTRRLTEAQVDKLLDALPAHRRGIAALIVALGATYPSELQRLTMANVDGHTVHLRGTKRESRDRHVPVPVFARRWLKVGLAALPLRSWGNVRRDLHKACDAAEIPRVSPNDLRRSMGSFLRARGADPHLIGLYLGHRDGRMAERVYGHVTPAELAHLLKKVG